ncbi:hypothetical protein C8J57DRAFT_1466095 [Mycena rebaudengoi]|nr:hypothetical protein C8J57DRAFT_1466095 [Mycena rebaudengoi]
MPRIAQRVLNIVKKTWTPSLKIFFTTKESQTAYNCVASRTGLQSRDKATLIVEKPASWRPLSPMRQLDIYRCGLCGDTVYKPVASLCIHIFYYLCIRSHLSVQKICPNCAAPIEVAPIRDDAFELDLFDAIAHGLIAP